MFQVTYSGMVTKFANGFRVSVQAGPGNYCANYGGELNFCAKCGQLPTPPKSSDAEMAVFDSKDNMVQFGSDTVVPNVSPADVLAVMIAATSDNPLESLQNWYKNLEGE